MAEQEIQAELAEQLEMQKTALNDIQTSIDAGCDDSELLELREQLEVAVAQLEGALLEVKRAALMQHVATIEDQVRDQQPVHEPGPATTSGALAEGAPCRCWMGAHGG